MESALAKVKGSVMELMSLTVFDVEWGEVVVLDVGIVTLGGMRLAAAQDRRQGRVSGSSLPVLSWSRGVRGYAGLVLGV